MKTRTVTKRHTFNALHSELDFGNDLFITTNNKIRQSRSLTLPQKRTLVAAAPAFVARGGTTSLACACIRPAYCSKCFEFYA